MRITANSSNHMNIMGSRQAAVKKMTRRTGMAYYLNDNRVFKSSVIRMVKTGLFDGYFYTVNFDTQTVKIMTGRDSFDCESFLFKIGH